MKMKKSLKKIFIIILAVYIMYTFISQQKVLNSYKTSQEYYTQQIEEKDFIIVPIIIDSNIEGYLIGSDVSFEIIKLVNAIIVNFFDITC